MKIIKSRSSKPCMYCPDKILMGDWHYHQKRGDKHYHLECMAERKSEEPVSLMGRFLRWLAK